MPGRFYYTHFPPPLELILDSLHLDNLAGRLQSFKQRFTKDEQLKPTLDTISKYRNARREKKNIIHQMARGYKERESLLESAEVVKPSVAEIEALAETEQNLRRLKKAFYEAQKQINLAFDSLELFDDALARQFLAHIKASKRWTRKRNLPRNMTKHQVLRCKIEMGCCARDCGCCEKPWFFLHEPIYAHCTEECGCCIDYLNTI